MINPGAELEKMLSETGISRKELSQRINVSEKHICTVINGRKGISSDFARKLGYIFKDTAYWLNLQAKYDEEQIREKEKYSISEEEIQLLKPLHDITDYFVEQGYMHNDCGDVAIVLQLRELLGVSDLLFIPNVTYNAAYRAQLSTNIKVNPYVLFAWQRLCEKETEKITISETLNKKKLQNFIPKIKSMMFGSIEDGISDLQNIFADCGIAFQVVKNFRGAPVQGFIKETSNGRLILCLTIRGKRADRFWFTLFHEIAHILNGDYKNRFVDFDSVQGEAEIIADTYARDTLIDSEDYKNFIHSDKFLSWIGIKRFAEKINVQPFIVLGRLQNDGLLEWSDYADKVEYYSWA